MKDMPTLRKGVLSLKEAYGQAMAVTAPLGSVVSTSTAAVAYAGYGVVFATLLGLIGSAMWVYTLTRYAKRVASAGGFYTYGSFATKSKVVAFFESITEAVAYTVLNAVNAFAVYLLLETFSQMSGIDFPSWAYWLGFVLTIAAPTLLSLIDVKVLLSRIVSVSATLEVLLLFGLFAYSVAVKGLQLQYFEVPKIPMSNLGDAMILTIVSISGAGAATYLGEETKVPLETITRGMWLSLGLGGLAILLGTYGMVSLWSGSLTSLENSPQPLLQEAIRLSLLFSLVVLLLSLNSLIMSNVGTTVGSARILFNLARERALPKPFMKLNRQVQPIVATVFAGMLSLIFGLAALAYTGFNVDQAFNEISVVVSVFWLAGRIVDAFGVPIMLFRLGTLNLIEAAVPIGAGVLNGIGLVLSYSSPDAFQVGLPLAVVVVGVVWYLLRARYSDVGRLVVDENNELVTIDEYYERLKRKASQLKG